MTDRYWTSEEYLRAVRVLDARKLSATSEEPPPCSFVFGGRCHGVASHLEEGWPLCKLCARRYLDKHPAYNEALNLAVRIAVDVEKRPHLVVTE